MDRPLFFDCMPWMASLLTPALLARCPYLEIHHGRVAREDLPRHLAGRRTLMQAGQYLDEATFAALPDLRHIVFLATDASTYMDVPAAERHGVAVHVIRNYGDRAIAEHALALIFACARKIALMDRTMRAGTWRAEEGLELGGRTLGVIGTGGVGRTVASLAHALGMRVLAWSRSGVPGDLPAEPRALDDLLRESDVVSLHVALTQDTRGLIDARRLALLKPGAILVNTARGAVVDETALLAELQAGRLLAGLDVYGTEPLPADHPLHALDNVVLSPHAAWKTPEAGTRVFVAGIEIMERLGYGATPTLPSPAARGRDGEGAALTPQSNRDNPDSPARNSGPTTRR